MSQDRSRFFNIYGVAMTILVVFGSCAFYLEKTSYAISAMSGIFLLMALEAIVDKQLNIRGKIVPKDENPILYFAMICVYLIGGVICLFLAIYPYIAKNSGIQSEH